MKMRGVIISLLALVVFFTAYAKAHEPEPEKPSTAAPVMVPYLNKSISEVKQNDGYSSADRGLAEETGQDRTEVGQDFNASYDAVLTTAGAVDAGEMEVAEAEPLSELVGDETDAGGTGADPVLTYYGCCRITFYDANSCCCGEFANGYTASGEPAIVGWTVANGELPFGTMVMIDGQTYCVTDRGVGADEFDILVDTHEEALARGLYYADVYIIN